MKIILETLGMISRSKKYRPTNDNSPQSVELTDQEALSPPITSTLGDYSVSATSLPNVKSPRKKNQLKKHKNQRQQKKFEKPSTG